MTERMMKRVRYLKEKQASGEYTLCPRCGRDTMRPSLITNALSRCVDDVFVCSDCGMIEALQAYMHNPLPISKWAAFDVRPTTNEYNTMDAEKVLQKVSAEQIGTLKEIFLRHTDEDECRACAFESCPGLTELWVDPFVARFAAKDGAVLVRFRQSEDGDTEYTIDITDE